MVTNDASILEIKHRVMLEVARLAWEGKLMGEIHAHIDPGKCRECGKCAQACPYNAIAHLERPCKKECPADAIAYDEYCICVID